MPNPLATPYTDTEENAFMATTLGWSFRITSPTTGHPPNLVTAGALLREARRLGQYTEALRWLARARRDNLTTLTLRQRHWMTSTSRRPARGRHHDSWAIREKYTQIGNS